jgi:hypothetical protein
MRLASVIAVLAVFLLSAYGTHRLLENGQRSAPVTSRTAKRPPTRHVAATAPANEGNVNPLQSNELRLLVVSSVGLCLVFAGTCLWAELSATRFMLAAVAVVILGGIEILEMSI